MADCFGKASRAPFIFILSFDLHNLGRFLSLAIPHVLIKPLDFVASAKCEHDIVALTISYFFANHNDHK